MALLLAIVLSLLTRECYADERSSVAYTLQEIARSNVDFANVLYALVLQVPGNLVFSPYSIHTIMAMTYLGAADSTAQQMQTGLRLPDDQEVTKHGFQVLTGELQKSKDVILSVANQIYLDKRFVVNPSYIETTQEFFSSGLESVDFMRNSERARQNINSWVADNTNDKIQDLLPQGFVDSSTVMVLVNAIYFKGTWNWFDERNTTPKPFYVNGVTPVTVPMMYTDKYVKIGDFPDIGVKVLELSYNGEEVSFIVVLPDALDGIYELEAKLPHLRLTDLASNLSGRKVQVSLPKLLLEQSMDLKDTLKKLGMADMFSGSADFSGITEQSVAVSNVVHKAYIEVNERGTVAAAATGVGIMLTSMPIKPIQFIADHPFIFFLRHNPTNAILFMGRFSEPREDARTAKTNTMTGGPAAWQPYYCR